MFCGENVDTVCNQWMLHLLAVEGFAMLRGIAAAFVGAAVVSCATGAMATEIYGSGFAEYANPTVQSWWTVNLSYDSSSINMVQNITGPNSFVYEWTATATGGFYDSWSIGLPTSVEEDLTGKTIDILAEDNNGGTDFIKWSVGDFSYTGYGPNDVSADGYGYMVPSLSPSFTPLQPVYVNQLYGVSSPCSDVCHSTFSLAPVLPPSGAPEPATWAMLVIGFFGLGASLRSRTQLAS